MVADIAFWTIIEIREDLIWHGNGECNGVLRNKSSVIAFPNDYHIHGCQLCRTGKAEGSGMFLAPVLISLSVKADHICDDRNMFPKKLLEKTQEDMPR